MSEWWGSGNAWLCEKANAHFVAWVNSPAAKSWRKHRNRSPYYYGYSQPDWMKDAREALGRNDEETFKAIKLENL